MFTYLINRSRVHFYVRTFFYRGQHIDNTILLVQPACAALVYKKIRSSYRLTFMSNLLTTPNGYLCRFASVHSWMH